MPDVQATYSTIIPSLDPDLSGVSPNAAALFRAMVQRVRANETADLDGIGSELGLTTSQRSDAYDELLELGLLEIPVSEIETLKTALGRRS